ncbi:MAG: hypothetical protein ACYCX5_12510 [Coriobacteriia bacterium]
MESIKKISIKTCGLDSKKNRGQVLRLVGIAHDTKVVETQYGESIGLKGEFRAINLITGANYQANTAYAPEVVVDPIVSALRQGADSVQFGFDISINEDAGSPVGFSYSAKSLIAPAENDPIAQLLGSMPPLQLMAPEESPATEPKAPKK